MFQVSANETSLRADGLEANTLYTFKLSACTVAGCTLSGDSSTVRTLQAGGTYDWQCYGKHTQKFAFVLKKVNNYYLKQVQCILQ